MTYSDLNAILLGELVHRVAGVPLDTLTARELAVPLGWRRTAFRPPRAWRSSIAPTNLWRGHPLAGEVNDPNAHRLGGVAGHAGLFGTGSEVARFAQLMLAEGVVPGTQTRLLRAETARAFTAVAVPRRGSASARALGWQATPTDEAVSSAGTLLGPRTYGHTGWTGTRMWLDPFSKTATIFLSNRNHPDEDGGVIALQRELGTLQWFYENKMSFNTLMSQQPQTLAFALSDSPVGLLAWNAQLFGEDLDADFILTNVMLYWLTGTAASAARYYYENAHAPHPTEPTTSRNRMASSLWFEQTMVGPQAINLFRMLCQTRC